jgi:membrane peptidoglycan carboxypeptidase
MEKDLPTDKANDPLSPDISHEQKPAGASPPRALLVQPNQQLQAIAPIHATRPPTTSDRFATHVLLLRRMRLNRKLLRHLRITRKYRRASSRLLQIVVAVLLVLLTLFTGSLGAAYAYYQSQLPVLNGIATHSLFQTTRIYDRNGKLLYELYSNQNNHGRRTYVNYQDIAPVMVQATVAAEDHTFWTNNGISVSGIVRAAITDLESHQIVEGASTITQQLIKNQLFLGEPRTIQVKSEEAILALGLTQQYPKWKIMEMYLNTVYYGDLNYGIEAAAEDYMGLQPRCTAKACVPAAAQLDLAQASLLAGLPQSPSYYNPTVNKAAALARQAVVLDNMVSLGMITRQQEAQAKAEAAKMTFRPYSATHHMLAPHFVEYVIDQVLVPLLGAQNLLTGGYSIYTSLDLTLEQYVEQSVYNHLYKPQYDSYFGYYGPLYQTNNVNNAAVVMMNPATGEILAMDGSANYNMNTPQMQGQFNAALALRQPGSSFKPVVYATAFEMGWYPAMIVPDHKTIYPGNLQPPYYTPQNYDGTFHTGYPMTIRTAVANSFNIPAIDTIEYVGIPNVLNMAARLGLTEVASKPLSSLGPSMAIGSTEVSLLHLTSAYATFANQGVRMPIVSVLEITNNVGQVMYRFNPAKERGVRAISPEVAFLINSMLSDKTARYHEFGPGNPLELDRPAAAKTGTTDSFRDNWTLGYTPYIVAGVWAGNSDNSIMNNVIGITGAGPIWHDVMEYASHHYNYPPDDFPRPSDVHIGTVSALNGLLPYPGEPTVSDWFIDGTMPTIYGPTYVPPRPTNPPCGENCNPTNPPNPGPPVPMPPPLPQQITIPGIPGVTWPTGNGWPSFP